jgi:hypothetical protein
MLVSGESENDRCRRAGQAAGITAAGETGLACLLSDETRRDGPGLSVSLEPLPRSPRVPPAERARGVARVVRRALTFTQSRRCVSRLWAESV